eukprot:6176683-Pleurochrysis_carterae.AAC.2
MDGVDMLSGYPDVATYSHLSMGGGLASPSEVVYTNAPKYHRQWDEALRAWHTAYSTSNSITVGMVHDVASSPNNLMIGDDPVDMLNSRSAGFTESVPACVAQASGAPSAAPSSEAVGVAPACGAASSSTAPLHSKLRVARTRCGRLFRLHPTQVT